MILFVLTLVTAIIRIGNFQIESLYRFPGSRHIFKRGLKIE